MLYEVITIPYLPIAAAMMRELVIMRCQKLSARLAPRGIDFPLNKNEDRMTKDIGQTQYCDWYFANQAVVIDTSGRYMLQEEKVVAEQVWPQFLSMLYQKRRRRPLNGIIFTLDVSQLQQQGEQALEQYARTVRSRIQQIQMRNNFV